MSNRASRVQVLERQAESLDEILGNELFPHPPELKGLLEWELAQFVRDVGRVEASSTSKVITVHGSVKRSKARDYDSDSFNAPVKGPPPSATSPFSARGTSRTTLASPKLRHTTRQTTPFDRHLREDLILRRTAVIPGMADDLAELCTGILAANPTRPWPKAHEFSERGRKREETSSVVKISQEDDIRDLYEYRQNAALYLFSTAMSTNGSWPDLVDRGQSLFYWTKGKDPDQTKAIPDATVHIDSEYLASEDSNAREDLVAALQDVIDQELSPVALWEFKDIVCATIEVMVAIREICSSTGVYQWLSCRDHPQCRGGCVDPTTRQYRVSGRLAWLDSPVVEEFLCQTAARKDVTLIDFKVTTTASDRSTARCIIQQLWAELANMEGTVAVIQCGNYEMIALRHRATQCLLLSDIQVTPGKRRPSHVKLHTGLTSLITADAIQRAKLAKVAKTMDENLLPSRMRNPSDFNLTAWRGGWNLDTKKTAQKEAPKRQSRSEKWPHDANELRRKMTKSRRVRVRFSGTMASSYTHLTLEPGGVLRLDNVNSVSADGKRPLVDSPSDESVVVLPGNNRGRNPTTDSITCNLGFSFDHDGHYGCTFDGIVAMNRIEVEGLKNQYNVHQALEQLGLATRRHVQRHLGLFLTPDHDFAILFLEEIQRKPYLPLSDRTVRYTNFVPNLAQRIEAFFNTLPLAHGSLVPAKILVRTDGASTSDDSARDSIIQFYVTGWRYGKVWGDALSDAARREKETALATDQAKLQGILAVLR